MKKSSLIANEAHNGEPRSSATGACLRTIVLLRSLTIPARQLSERFVRSQRLFEFLGVLAEPGHDEHHAVHVLVRFQEAFGWTLVGRKDCLTGRLHRGRSPRKWERAYGPAGGDEIPK